MFPVRAILWLTKTFSLFEGFLIVQCTKTNHIHTHWHTKHIQVQINVNPKPNIILLQSILILLFDKPECHSIVYQYKYRNAQPCFRLVHAKVHNNKICVKSKSQTGAGILFPISIIPGKQWWSLSHSWNPFCVTIQLSAYFKSTLKVHINYIHRHKIIV